MATKFYITTPLYYINASPHIGHSYTTIAADCLARSMRRAIGRENVRFLTGTDEHGQKIQKAADGAAMDPQRFADTMVVRFKDLWTALNISYDDFIRTTEERHTGVVQKVLEILYKKGDIYQDTYEGWYCTPCETFWMESQLVGKACPDCKRPAEKIAEKNYFFRLSKYQEWLITHIEASPLFIRPQIRRNEILSFLRMNVLTDLCISRPRERLNWGIPVPFSPDHVTYVWFDALINYISAVGAFGETGYNSPWWQSDVKVVQLIGKDILRQHAIYWPIMLYALGIRQPDTIFAHGWWLIDDDKMSKSRGTVVNPIDMVNTFGLDVYRYFLLRDVPFGLDGNFSQDAIIRRFNSDLANDLGNLVYRTLTMVEKYFQGETPVFDIKEKRYSEQGEQIKKEMGELDLVLATHLSAGSDFDFSAALQKIWELVNMVNKYIEDTKPWTLSKENRIDDLKAFIRLLVEAIRKVGTDLEPFMPATAAALHDQIGSDRVKKGKPLFPRILSTI